MVEINKNESIMMSTNTILTSQIDQAIQRRLASIFFWEFCLWYDAEFFTKRSVLKIIADAFQEVYDNYINGKAIRVAVSIPSRAGKSYTTSLFCAWWLGKLPELCIMRNTCTAELYMDFSYAIRDIVRSEKYQEVFPHIKLSRDRQNIRCWSLESSRQAAYFGAGVDGNIIGKGANLAITDDLYSNMDQALSEAYNNKVIRWFESVHKTRRAKGCPEIYIGTRWSKRDLMGRRIEGGWINKEIRIPALIQDEDGNVKSFCEDVRTTQEFLEERDGNGIDAGIDETIWMAAYMQEPIENKGLLFPLSDLKTFHITDIKQDSIDYTLIIIDPADRGGDNYAALLAYVIANKVFVAEAIFNNHGTDINIPASVELAVNSKANYVQIEGNSGWILAGKNIRNMLNERLPHCEVRIVKATENKETRILTHSAWIKHNIYFRADYKSYREYYAFMNNVTQYLREGGNKHDDGPDALVMLAEYCMRNLSHLW